jgi:hypothetical protein
MIQKTAPSAKSSHAPSHIVWFAPEREGAPWARIGVLWPIKSGKGFRMNLELIPTVPGSTLILPNEPREVPEEESAASGDGPDARR